MCSNCEGKELKTLRADIADMKMSFLKQHGCSDFKYVYILDDWNAIESTSQASKLRANILNYIVYHWDYKLVTVLSPRAASGCETTRGFQRYALLHTVNDDAEWQALLDLHMDAIEKTVIASRDDDISKEQILHELEDLTSRIPIMVKELLKKFSRSHFDEDDEDMDGVELGTVELHTDDSEREVDLVNSSVDDVPVSWTRRLSEFDKNETEGAGGKWISKELCRFTSTFIKGLEGYGAMYTELKMHEYINTMIRALRRLHYSCSQDEYYDHRLFYKMHGVLLPSCGYVRNALARSLTCVESCDTNFLRMLNSTWVDAFLTRMFENPPMIRIAYEEYCIARLLLNDEKELQSIIGCSDDETQNITLRTVRFSGDYPSPENLNIRPLSALLFRPV